MSLGIVVGPAGGVIDKGSWDSRPFRLGISSWKRIDDNSMPPRIKCAANYQNARMALIQAETDGYDGALMLDASGHVAEEARACIFLVREGAIKTDSLQSDKNLVLSPKAEIDSKPSLFIYVDDILAGHGGSSL